MSNSEAIPAAQHKVLLSTLEGVPCALLLQDGALVDILLEKGLDESSPGDLHVVQIRDVVPGLKAAFAEMGISKPGFLPLTETRGPRSTVKSGQRMILRVLRSSGGDKGPRMTREMAIPGMSMVLYPQGNRIDFSRKITDKEERKRLETIVGPPLKEAEMGALLRTAARGLESERLLTELQFLIDEARRIFGAFAEDVTPRRVYAASSLVSILEREWLPIGVSEVWVDNKAQAEAVERILQSPWNACMTKVRLNEESRSLKRVFGLQKALDRMRYKQLWLPSGGTIVIEQTEAMTVIDVNSGKFSGGKKTESLAKKINLEASKVIAEQIRLRGIVGIIVVDFIDMEHVEERAAIHQRMESLLASDPAKTRTLPISAVGLMQLTRQRTGRGAGQLEPIRCSHCRGTGKKDRFAGMLEQVKDDVWGILQSLSTPPAEIRIEAREDVMRAIRGSGLLSHLEETTGIPMGLEGRSETNEKTFIVRAI